MTKLGLSVSNSSPKQNNKVQIPNQTKNHMLKRSIKRKLIKAKITLNQTIQKILEINRTRKKLPYSNNAHQKQNNLNEELKVLNQIVKHQAKLIQKYEQFLSGNRKAS